MRLKRFTRGPLFWLALALLGFIIATQVIRAGGGFERVDTSTAIAAVEGGEVKSAKIVTGDQQELQLTLKNGDQILASYVDGQQVEIGAVLQEQADSGTLPEGYDVEVPQPSVFLTILGALLPFLLLGLLLLFFITIM